MSLWFLVYLMLGLAAVVAVGIVVALVAVAVVVVRGRLRSAPPSGAGAQ